MGIDLVGYFLFYPETPHPSLPFHISRHLFIIFLTYLTFVLDPSFFTVFFLILSILEYTRKGHLRAKILLYCTLLFANRLFFKIQSKNQFIISAITPIIRTTILYIPFILDSILYEKVNFTKRETDLVFPILLRVCSFILTEIDPHGIAVHISSYCSDYPDFSFLPLRFAGPNFLVFIISFVACICSRWKSTHYLPRSVTKAIFKLIPILIVFVFFGRFFWEAGSDNITISGFTDNLKCSEIAKMFTSKAINSNITVFGSPVSDCSQRDLQTLRDHSDNNLIIIDVNGTLAFKDGKEYRKQGRSPFLVGSGNSSLSALILNGDDILRMNSYLEKDADLIISFDCSEDIEKRGYPERTATFVAQTTGAHRLHIGKTYKKGNNDYRLSFLVNAAGHTIFREISNKFTHSTKLAKNVFYFAKIRQRISNVIFVVLFAFSIVIVCKPNITSYFVFSKKKIE